METETEELRDMIAVGAMAALIKKLPLHDAEGELGQPASKEQNHRLRMEVAESAYDYADAMLAVRARKAA